MEKWCLTLLRHSPEYLPVLDRDRLSPILREGENIKEIYLYDYS
jgi:hypothetical protein